MALSSGSALYEWVCQISQSVYIRKISKCVIINEALKPAHINILFFKYELKNRKYN